ncbi:BQ5605_C031g10989 [Microbotryum silenes-dioicae]|uniref:BQ5605_C031g10989 protein n=1 Tax=Microbotryum silenes-dioicae TaxID=796604 RepID=A0A2X0NAN6_9BASI|nr:BQ5605_C031g10989 [Microbotryum silenes-dioicae]
MQYKELEGATSGRGEFDRPDPARDKLGLFLTFGSASDQSIVQLKGHSTTALLIAHCHLNKAMPPSSMLAIVAAVALDTRNSLKHTQTQGRVVEGTRGVEGWDRRLDWNADGLASESQTDRKGAREGARLLSESVDRHYSRRSGGLRSRECPILIRPGKQRSKCLV